MKLQALENVARFSRREGFVEGGRGVRVQVILRPLRMYWACGYTSSTSQRTTLA
jgi:hypothetical protein